ncbi:exonuclease domain-containing protein [Cellulosimicrobium arenosum]|uniref:DNA polymerase III subunit epsilon n=1 Tax=Cellulosimicrobium arenosum TaxID=2708133 RepID=A0A927J119_9MICO|nr:DNA polymerase III subunit epsilon [Cellulosimicrobium arenosum]
MPGFAVVDLETTGFSPRLGDRVAEVAVVLLDDAGRVEDEWCSLVNPCRDLGPQHVHGITAADVALAPTFDRVAPALLRLLDGRVLVAHNASFDTRFLRAELGRAGIAAAIDPLACVCTQQLAGRYLTGSRGLAACCAAVGIVHDDVHSALGDARATAGLLAHYLDVAADDECWAVARAAAAGVRWTLPPECGDPAGLGAPSGPVLRGASRRHAHWLSGLDVAGTPRDTTGTTSREEYRRLLDLALLDRYVSHSERAALLATARDAGLTRGDVESLHRDHLADLARQVLDETVLLGEVAGGDASTRGPGDHADDRSLLGALSVDADLHEVAGQLGLDADDVAGAAQAALGARLVDEAGTGVGQREAFTLGPRDEIVLTGSMRRTREAWEDDVRRAGLEPWRYVRRRTRLVVAADPDSLSTKARTARRYGIPVVTEDAFARMLRRPPAARPVDPAGPAGTVGRWAS